MSGFGLLAIAGAAGVGVDASFVLVPLVLLPLVLAVVVLLGGSSSVVLLISAIAGIGYAGLGIWNYFWAAAFEEANPGSTEASGGAVSVTFVLLALVIALWSLGAAAIARGARSGEQQSG
jgi:hypothetical protein